MTSTELVQLAALVANHGPQLIQNDAPLSESCLRRYWTAAKCRLHRWGLALSRCQKAAGSLGNDWNQAQWYASLPTMQEVLTAEILTRVWTAVACGHDRRHLQNEAEPIVFSIFTGHNELRNRVLQLMVHGPAAEDTEMLALNGLRRRCERWTDLLISYLLAEGDVSEFAADPQRCREFAEGIDRQRQAGVAVPAWDLVATSYQAAFSDQQLPAEGCDDLNDQIAGSIIGSFPPDLFDSTGIFQSLWVTRLEQMADDTEGLVDQLLELEELPVRSF